MLSEAIDRHIELYRSVGFKYRVQEYMLRSFGAFAEGRSELFIRTETVLAWAASAPSVRQRCDRLLTIRRLARALKAEDERHEVPPSDVFGRAPRSHRKCHIFTQGEINILLRSTAQLGPKRSIRLVTYIALLSLITATGLRISEALRLQVSDITDEGLLIRETKFQKSRLVPLHASARRGLLQYLAVRWPLCQSLHSRSADAAYAKPRHARICRPAWLDHRHASEGSRIRWRPSASCGKN